MWWRTRGRELSSTSCQPSCSTGTGRERRHFGTFRLAPPSRCCSTSSALRRTVVSVPSLWRRSAVTSLSAS
jgi:hypothetical protein